MAEHSINLGHCFQFLDTTILATGLSTQHFLPVMAHPVHHFAPLLTTSQAHSLSARTGLFTSLSVPVVGGLMWHIAPLLPLVSLSFPLPTGCQTLTRLTLSAFIYAPFPSVIHFTLKMEAVRSSKVLVSYCDTTLHHSLEDLNLNVYHHENLKSCIMELPYPTFQPLT